MNLSAGMALMSKINLLLGIVMLGSVAVVQASPPLSNDVAKVRFISTVLYSHLELYPSDSCKKGTRLIVPRMVSNEIASLLYGKPSRVDMLDPVSPDEITVVELEFKPGDRVNFALIPFTFCRISGNFLPEAGKQYEISMSGRPRACKFSANELVRDANGLTKRIPYEITKPVRCGEDDDGWLGMDNALGR